MNKHGQYVIAIDGSSASGKSTLSERLTADYGAKRLEYSAFFRLIADHMLQQGFTPGAPPTPSQIDEAARFAASLTDWQTIESLRKDRDLNTIEISRTSPYFSGERAILDATDATLRTLIDASRDHPVIVEGRTIGKYVYPGSDVKLYIDADIDTRATRRAGGLRAKGKDITTDSVKHDLLKRDEQDQTRPYQPTGYDPEHHRLIDNTGHTIEESLTTARHYIHSNCPELAETYHQKPSLPFTR